MSVPVLERRPTHQALPLLRSEISRLTHRRLFRVLALILLGGTIVVSLLSFVSHENRAGSTNEELRQIQIQQQVYWEDCADNSQDPEAFCGPEPRKQSLETFEYGADQRYKAYELLPVAVIGASFAAAGVAFIMGASSGGAEWSSRSMTLQLLFEPRRLRLLALKWLGLVLTLIVLSLVTMVSAVGLGALTASTRGTWDERFALTPEVKGELWQTLATMGLRGLLLVALAATLGYGIAMLVRNTGASLGVAFVYFVLVEGALRWALWDYGPDPFMLSTNSAALLVPGGIEVPAGTRGSGAFEEVKYVDLSNLRAMVTLTGYTIVLSVAAVWSFTRRDVS
jgi:ABC-type transport system involved in multi-copper enzyme maturation permease subunit